MHPKEFKQTRAGTGRFAHIALADSELHVGVEFENFSPVQSLLHDPTYSPMLLYPGPESRNLSQGGLTSGDLGGKRLLVFLLDATWACAKKMLKLSPSLQVLPRIGFIPEAKSRWIIKQQPDEMCLSTLEATHELLIALEKSGLDHYERPQQLLEVFQKMQDFQLQCASDPAKDGYRRKPYRPPSERVVTRQDRSGRNLFFQG